MCVSNCVMTVEAVKSFVRRTSICVLLECDGSLKSPRRSPAYKVSPWVANRMVMSPVPELELPCGTIAFSCHVSPPSTET